MVLWSFYFIFVRINILSIRLNASDISSNNPAIVVIVITDSNGFTISNIPRTSKSILSIINHIHSLPIIVPKLTDNCNLNKLLTIIHIPNIIENMFAYYDSIINN